MNISATLNVCRLFLSPSLCLPHLQASNFNELRFPLVSTILPTPLEKKPSIRAIVLDKDNCFASNHDDKVWPIYKSKWTELRAKYPEASLLIVSNSEGTNDDPGHAEAARVEANTGIPVLRHSTKKPGCYPEILEYFYANGAIDFPSQIAIVGDRLFTDILMANMMGAQGVWLSKGVVESQSLICKIERFVYNSLIARGYKPPSVK